VIGVLYLTVPVAPDHALFDYIAWSRLRGDVYYADVAEQNWPGAMFLHELGIRLFGVHFWTFRLMDFLTLQGVTMVGAWFLYRAGFRIAPWIFLVVYPILYVTTGIWMAGQRDIVAAGFLVAAAAITMAAWTPTGDVDLRGSWLSSSWYLLAGALVAFAVLTRPTYLTYLVGLTALEWLRFSDERGRRNASLRCTTSLLLGFALPVVALILIGLWTNSLDDFYEQTILFNLEAYPVEESRLRLVGPIVDTVFGAWHWISTLAFGGLILWIRAAGLLRAQVLIVGLIATVLISYVFQNKGFGYHLGGILPALCLLVGVLVDQLATWRQLAIGISRRILGIALAAALTLVSVGTISKAGSLTPHARMLAEGRFEPYYSGQDRPSWADISTVVQTIRADSGPDEYILQWGRLFEVGFLAQRPSTLRFVSTPALGLLSSEFSGTERWLAEVRHDLEAKRPAFVVIERAALVMENSAFQARPAAPEAERLVVESLAGYSVVFETASFVLFRANW
jgi:hypothetical protein